MHGCRSLTVVALLLGCGCIACGGDDDPVATGAGGAGGGSSTGGSGGAATTAGALLPCPPGELEEMDGGCLAPGVPADGCGEGFTLNADAACDPVLPGAPCAAGQMALPGESQCRAVGSCGSGNWGAIPTDITTMHVDGTYNGGNNDGSSAAPFTTVQQAINAAQGGAIVAIANGSYNENLSISNKSVRLWGRCAEGVTLSAAGQTVAMSDAGGSEIRGVSITGADIGLRVQASNNVVVDGAVIHDTGDEAIELDGDSSVTVRGSLIDGATRSAIITYNGDVTLEDSVVRDVNPTANGSSGIGIDARGFGPTPDVSVTVRHSVIIRAHTHGIGATGPVTVLVEDSYVAGTRAEPSTTLHGQGIHGYWLSTQSDGERPTITVRRSVLADNTWNSLHTEGPHLVLDSTVVRDTQLGTLDGTGAGIDVWPIETTAGGERPRLTVHRSVIERSFGFGMAIRGAEVHIESSIVRDVEPQTDGFNGLALTAWPSYFSTDGCDVTLVGSRFERAHQGNVAISGSTATIDSIAVLDTRPRAVDMGLGVPLAVMINPENGNASSATIQRTVVDGGYATGLAVAGSQVTMSDIVVRNILPQQNIDDFGDGITISATFPLLPGLHPTSGALSRVTVEGMPRAGVAVFAAEATISDSMLSCNTIDLAGETYEGGEFMLEDGGGNICECDGETIKCRVLTSNLRPPLGI